MHCIEIKQFSNKKSSPEHPIYASNNDLSNDDHSFTKNNRICLIKPMEVKNVDSVSVKVSCYGYCLLKVALGS